MNSKLEQTCPQKAITLCVLTFDFILLRKYKEKKVSKWLIEITQQRFRNGENILMWQHTIQILIVYAWKGLFLI